MLGYKLTSGILAVIVVGFIFWLIRKDHLHPKKALGWVTIACAIGVIGIFPRLSDWIASKLGVGYPPTLVLVISIILIFLKLLRLDTARSQEDKKIAILTQRLVVLEKRFENVNPKNKD